MHVRRSIPCIRKSTWNLSIVSISGRRAREIQYAATATPSHIGRARRRISIFFFVRFRPAGRLPDDSSSRRHSAAVPSDSFHIKYYYYHYYVRLCMHTYIIYTCIHIGVCFSIFISRQPSSSHPPLLSPRPPVVAVKGTRISKIIHRGRTNARMYIGV